LFFPPHSLYLGRVQQTPEKWCELNRWMQHHLIEIICF
jgi:hypothetical protein